MSRGRFKTPDQPDIQIWRYMDFTKFVSMLANNGLFFARLDRLGDQFEGSLPKNNMWDPSSGVPAELKNNPQFVAEISKSLVKLRQLVRHLRAWVYASTWHMAEYESAAMWKLYARTEEAICVQSTFLKLSKLVPPHVHLGEVIYIDYDRATIPLDDLVLPYLHKRRSFEHEREVRAIIADMAGAFERPPSEPAAGGIWCRIDLGVLIERIYVAPTAPDWFLQTVNVILEKFRLDVPVLRSSLDESPMW